MTDTQVTSRFGGYEDQPFVAELYDLIPGYRARPDLDFFLSYSRAVHGKTLELGCGTGRILIPTAAAGCEIVGLDVSEYMLAKCRQKLAGQSRAVQQRARLIRGSMSSFDLGETFSLVTTPFRSFQHLVSVREQLACLHCANGHLAMGGKIILDLFQVNSLYITNPDSAKETEDFADSRLGDGRKLKRTHRIAAFHPAEQYNDVEMTYYITHPDGKVESLVQAYPFRYFFRYEVEHLLARCGFNTVEIFGHFDGSPFCDQSPEMIFVAEKVQEVKKKEAGK